MTKKTKTAATPSVERISYSVREAAATSGMSERYIRAAIASGDLVAYYMGKKPLILATELTAWITSKPNERRVS